jgi:hypothetical protein
MDIQGIVETGIYADDHDDAEAFDRDVPGLRLLGKELAARSTPQARSCPTLRSASPRHGMHARRKATVSRAGHRWSRAL